MLTWALKKVFGTSHEREISRLRPRVEAINALEAAHRQAHRRRAQGQDGRVQAEARQRRDARRHPARGLRRLPRGGQARPQDAPLRRAAHRRHGPPQGLHRRDAHRRGQDARGHAALLPERARGQGRPRRHRERLPRQARRRVDGQALRLPRPERRASSSTRRASTRRRPPTAPTSPTARTTSSASTTCATT